MIEYEILTYIANTKDGNGEPIFRPNNDTKEYILPIFYPELGYGRYLPAIEAKNLRCDCGLARPVWTSNHYEYGALLLDYHAICFFCASLFS